MHREKWEMKLCKLNWIHFEFESKLGQDFLLFVFIWTCDDSDSQNFLIAIIFVGGGSSIRATLLIHIFWTRNWIHRIQRWRVDWNDRRRAHVMQMKISCAIDTDLVKLNSSWFALTPRRFSMRPSPVFWFLISSLDQATHDRLLNIFGFNYWSFRLVNDVTSRLNLDILIFKY